MAAAAIISIHAPVKGATWTGGRGGARSGPISIHAPVKGATHTWGRMER